MTHPHDSCSRGADSGAPDRGHHGSGGANLGPGGEPSSRPREQDPQADPLRPSLAVTTAAFCALTTISAGDWDRFLLRLRAAIAMRMATPDYRRHIVAGDSDGS